MAVSLSELVVVRPATEEDVSTLMALIEELAVYEKLTHLLVATEESLKESLFGRGRVAEALIGEYDGEPVGYAIFFHNFSTFLGRAGIYLEDIYVRPECRGKGLGKAMLVQVAKIAKDRGCGRMEWSCLNWNTPSIEFYKSLGAEPLEGWTMFRLTGKTLDDVAGMAE